MFPPSPDPQVFECAFQSDVVSGSLDIRCQ